MDPLAKLAEMSRLPSGCSSDATQDDRGIWCFPCRQIFAANSFVAEYVTQRSWNDSKLTRGGDSVSDFLDQATYACNEK